MTRLILILFLAVMVFSVYKTGGVGLKEKALADIHGCRSLFDTRHQESASEALLMDDAENKLPLPIASGFYVGEILAIKDQDKQTCTVQWLLRPDGSFVSTESMVTTLDNGASRKASHDYGGAYRIVGSTVRLSLENQAGSGVRRHFIQATSDGFLLKVKGVNIHFRHLPSQ